MSGCADPFHPEDCPYDCALPPVDKTRICDHKKDGRSAWRATSFQRAPNTAGNSGRGRTTANRRECALCGFRQKKVYKPRFPGVRQVKSRWVKDITK
jgi:hypothetical protein